MLQELLKLMPTEAGDGALILAMIGTVVGVGFWVAGVKTSRPLVTLLTVLAGAAIGLQLPRWFNWGVSGSGPAVGGAILLGVAGFTLHRMWLGLSLGVIVAWWAAVGIWLMMHGKTTWAWPAIDESTTACSYLKSAWANVPPDIARLLPWSSAVAVISALAAAILWPRLVTAIHWSALGLTMIVCLGLMAINAGQHPERIEKLPQSTLTQNLVLFALLLLGVVIQWKLAPKSAKAEAAPKPKAEP